MFKKKVKKAPAPKTKTVKSSNNNNGDSLFDLREIRTRWLRGPAS